MVFEALGFGPAVFNGLVVIALVGFPIAVGLAWTFDVTPEGVRRTGPAAPGEQARQGDDRWVRLKAAFVGAGFVVVAWAGLRLWQPIGAEGPGADSGAEPLLAVLPFQDFSPEADQAYFVDGLHEEILHQLAQVSGIRIPSRTSLAHFRGSGLSGGAIADSLGADYLIEGSVRPAVDSVNLTVQLINARTDEHVWSVSLTKERTIDGIFDLQRTFAMRVAGDLGGTLRGGRGETSAEPPTRSLDAYNEYLRGLYHFTHSSPEDDQAAVEHFGRAVALDPDFGLAHARLSGSLAVMNNYGGRTQGEVLPLVREHAEAAMRLAPTEPQAHLAMMGVSWTIDRDWDRAREHTEQALELDPDNVDALWALAEWHGVIAGNTERGLQLLNRAADLDPYSSQIGRMRVWILMSGRRFEEALTEVRRILELDPGNTSAARNLVTLLAFTGRTEEARQALAYVRELIRPPYPVTLAAHAARAGETEFAREVLRSALDLKESGGSVAASGIAVAYAALGETESALDWLERSFEEEGGIYYLSHPDWDQLAAHPRFQALWDELGLPGRHPVLDSAPSP